MCCIVLHALEKKQCADRGPSDAEKGATAGSRKERLLRTVFGNNSLLYLTLVWKPVEFVVGVFSESTFLYIISFSCAFEMQEAFEAKKKKGAPVWFPAKPFVFSVICSMQTQTRVCNLCRDNPLGETRPKEPG